MKERQNIFEERLKKSLEFIVGATVAKHMKSVHAHLKRIDIRLINIEASVNKFDEQIRKLELDFNSVFLYIHERVNDLEDKSKLSKN